MMKKTKSFFVIMSLLVIVSNAVAYTFTKGDFEITISKIEPSDREYFLPGDEVNIIYEFKPIDSEVADNMRQKLCEVSTYLVVDDIYNNFQIGVNFVGGGFVSFPTSDAQISYERGRTLVKFEFPNVQNGVSKVKVDLKGRVPEIDTRWEELCVLRVNLSGAEEGTLEPLTVNVLNKDIFESDIDKMDGKIKEIEADLQSLEEKGYPTSDLKDILDEIKADFSKAEDNFRVKEYVKANDYLTSAEEGVGKYYSEKDRIVAETDYNNQKEKIDELNNLLSKIDANITLLYKGGKIDNVIYTQLYRNYDELVGKLDDIQKSVESVKSDYFDEEKYSDAINKLEETKKKLDDLEGDVKNLNSRVSAYFGEREERFDIGKFLGDYGLLILGVVVVALVVVVAVLLFRGRGGKWDELR